MVTLLIGDPDLKFAKSIISNIVKNNERMRLIDITTTEEETIKAIKEYTPHIAIINTDMVNMDLFKKIEHKPSIVPFTENDMKSAIKKYYLKNTNIKLIEKRVNELIRENDYAQTKEKVVNIFSKLKFNFSRSGTTYLMESILYSYEHKNSFIYENLEKYVYPEVAKKYNTSAVNVKWVIVKAINEMYNRNCTDNTLNTVADFFYFTNKVKPTAKVVLTTVLAKLDC